MSELRRAYEDLATKISRELYGTPITDISDAEINEGVLRQLESQSQCFEYLSDLEEGQS